MISKCITAVVCGRNLICLLLSLFICLRVLVCLFFCFAFSLTFFSYFILTFFYLEKVGRRCSSAECPGKAKACLSHYVSEADKFCTCSTHSIYLKKEKVCVGKCYTFMFNTDATRSTANRLAKLIKVAGSKHRPDQHSGFLNNCHCYDISKC